MAEHTGPGQQRLTLGTGAYADAVAPILAALAAPAHRDRPLPEELLAAARTPRAQWTAHQARRTHLLITGPARRAVEDAGYDPDLIPAPASRLLDLLAPASGSTGPQVALSVAEPLPSTLAAIKSLPGLSWDATARHWAGAVHPSALPGLRALVRDHDVLVTPEAADALRALAAAAADPANVDAAAGTVTLAEKGRVLVRLAVANPAIADDLKRVSGLRWDGEQQAYLAPASRLREVASLAGRHGLLLLPPAAKALAAQDAPLNYDGTLDGLRGVPVTDLHAVDEKKAERLAEFGITSVFDLLMHIPLRYLDRSNLTPIRSLAEGDEVGILATISALQVDQRRRMVKITVTDGTGKLGLTYFNAVWQAKRFRVGDEVAIYGKVEAWQGSGRKVLSITNPVMDPVGDDTLPVIPIYPQSAKTRVTTWDLHTAAAEALRRLGTLVDPMPEQVRADNGLTDRAEALRMVHLPTTPDAALTARTRLAFDELFRMQTALLLSKAAEESEAGVAHRPTGALTSALISALPFPLTGAQSRAIAEIDANLRAPHPMHRLLQGDVGAGKTVLALWTLLAGVESGHQGALMAPTEILATQLFNEISERTAGLATADGTPLRVEFFSNKLRGRKRDAALADLASGAIHIAVGTHALLVPDVAFASLGVVVVDEQHRFGVEQRAALRDKGPLGAGADGAPVHLRPDMLVMTATPIPRTAALCVFGDLDLTILDELPPGRTPIRTSWIDEAPELGDPAAGPWPLVRAEVAKGRQGYIVCPLVEESEKMQAASAVETFEALAAGALRGLRLGLVHGQQKPEERAETMTAFRDGDLDVLVATTVIEVGVNVPNATAIVILDSGRFGIAQLHQLRGRVGRGAHASECVLVGRCTSTDSRTRMQALVDSTDGFYLSEVDLGLRGHGSVFGTSQSGQSDLRVADLGRDRELLFAARAASEGLLDEDPGLARRPALRAEIAATLDPDAVAWLQKS